MPDVDIQDVPVDAGEVPPQSDNARSAPKGKNKIAGIFGDNKKTRGGPRKLVRADVEKLAGIYALVGMALMPAKPKLGMAFGQQAEACAEAWANWADQNDAIRRTILWLIEGGAAGAVFMAHLPILAVAIPEDRIPPFLAAFNGQQGEGVTVNGQFAPFAPEA